MKLDKFDLICLIKGISSKLNYENIDRLGKLGLCRYSDQYSNFYWYESRFHELSETDLLELYQELKKRI